MIAALLHMFEEFAFPGGFACWFRRYRPESASDITVKKLVTINALLLLFCLGGPITTDKSFGIAEWLTVTALFFGNAIFHIRAAIAMREYSPGLITSVFLYMPLAIAGYIYFLEFGNVPLRTALIAFFIGVSFEVFSSLQYFLMRLKQKQNMQSNQ